MEENNTIRNAWTFAPDTITVNSHSFPASYSVAKNGDVYIFTAVKAAADSNAMPVRLHITPDMPEHGEAVAAAKAVTVASAQDKPAVVQDAPKPATDALPPAAKAEQSEETVLKPAVITENGLVNCRNCPVKDCVHEDAYRRNPQNVGGLGLCPRLDVKPPHPIPEQPEPEQATPAERQPAKPAVHPQTEKPWIGQEIQGKGWRIAFDGAAQRTRVIIDGKPTAAQKDAINAAGFFWSQTLGSWNKKLTCKAYRAAQELAKTLTALA